MHESVRHVKFHFLLWNGSYCSASDQLSSVDVAVDESLSDKGEKEEGDARFNKSTVNGDVQINVS